MVEWGKVQTNVVSAMLVGLVGSAVAVVWNGATTVDQKVDHAVSGVQMQQQVLADQTEYIKKAIEVLQEELAEARKRDREIIAALENNDKDRPKLVKPELLEDRFIQNKLPELNVQQMAPRIMPHGYSDDRGR